VVDRDTTIPSDHEMIMLIRFASHASIYSPHSNLVYILEKKIGQISIALVLHFSLHFRKNRTNLVYLDM
jgi:hypothetical protein